MIQLANPMMKIGSQEETSMNSVNTPLQIGTQEAVRVLKGITMVLSVIAAVAGLFLLGWGLGA